MACTYTKADDQLALVQRVEQIIDAVKADGQLEGVNRSGIYSNLETAVRRLLRGVDDHIALFASTDGSVAAEAGKVAIGTASWVFPIPADFMRFLRVKIDNWERSVDEITARHDPKYIVQANPFQAHDEYRPFAVLIPDSSAPSNQAMDIFPHTDAADIISVFEYVPAQCPEDVIEDLVDPMLYFAAGLTFLSTDQSQRAPVAFQAVTALINSLRAGFADETNKSFGITDQGMITNAG